MERLTITTTMEVQLSRGQGPDGPHWNLRISDRRSRIILVDLRLEDWQLGQALGCQAIEAEGATSWSAVVGKYLRAREILVPIPEELTFGRYDASLWAQAVQNYLRDHDLLDWTPTVASTWNTHNFKNGNYRVGLRKWEDEDQGSLFPPGAPE